MQTAKDRERQIRRYGEPPARPAVVLVKCLAGFIVLLVILVLGAYASTDEAMVEHHTTGVPAPREEPAAHAGSYGVCLGRAYAYTLKPHSPTHVHVEPAHPGCGTI